MRTAHFRLSKRAREGKWVCGELIAHRGTHDTRRPRFYAYRGQRDGMMTLARVCFDGTRRLMWFGMDIEVPMDRRNEYMAILRMMTVVPC